MEIPGRLVNQQAVATGQKPPERQGKNGGFEAWL
jgi:hypothetical protein